MTLPLDRIMNVMELRSPAQMGRVAARFVVARVKGVGEAIRRWAISKVTGDARCYVLDAAFSGACHCEKAIPRLVSGFGNPRPTFVSLTDLDFAPKSGDVCFGHSKHSGTVKQPGAIVKW